MRAYPIDTHRTNLLSTSIVSPVTAWIELSDGKRRPDPNGRQETDESGRGLWRVEVVIPADPLDDRDKTNTVEVLVASHDRPEPGPFGTPVRFEGLVMMPGYVKRATGELTAPRWSAEGVQSGNGGGRGKPAPAPEG